MKTLKDAHSESTCQKRVTIVDIYDQEGNLLSRESNRCNPDGGKCSRLGVVNTKTDYPVESTCNWTHAEVNAIKSLPVNSKPHKSVLYGHLFYCDACEAALKAVGVQVLEMGKPIEDIKLK